MNPEIASLCGKSSSIANASRLALTTAALVIGCAASFAASSTASFAAAADGPPVAPLRPVTDTYFGTAVVDRYRYLENLRAPEVQEFMKAEAGYTRSVLDRLPGRTALLERIHALGAVDVSRSRIQRRGTRYFYQLTEPGAQQPKLVYRDGLDGAEHPLVDPATLAKDASTHFALDFYAPSWDGKLVAYGLSTGGSEASTLHVMDVATGKDTGEHIERANNAVVSWRPDNRSFFYLKFAKPTPAMSLAETQYNARTYLHVVGGDADGENDPVVFGRGVSALDVPEGQATYVIGSPSSAYVVAVANHNFDDNPSTLYVAPLARVAGARTPWKKIADVEDGVSGVGLRGDTLFFLSRKNASRFRILATSLKQPDVRHARVVVAEGREIITAFGIAQDGLYYRQRDGVVSQLMRVGFDGGTPHAVPMPFDGSSGDPIVAAGVPGVMFSLQSWSRPLQVFAFDPASDRTTDSGFVPPSKVDASQIESNELVVTSYDGTLVPLSIVYRKGLVLDGSHPTILTGYGSYGIVLDSSFSASAIAWLERGGVLATAHVRGGGEYGEDWHLAGMMKTKMNTVFDFIACGEYLVAQKYTTPKRLAGRGGSAGGITVGGAMTMRPDLFAVILDAVGISDTLRAETEPNGPPNVVEFGSVKTEDGFHGLYAMGAYYHVVDGTPYPAVMFITGANDPRVSPWHMTKMAARTQAATSSGKSVLLRIDYDAGHGIGSNRSQREETLADTWAFTLWQMGDPQFQPR